MEPSLAAEEPSPPALSLKSSAHQSTLIRM
jgi:hypothetical protein